MLCYSFLFLKHQSDISIVLFDDFCPPGHLDAAEFTRFNKEFDNALLKASSRRGNSRSAASNVQGHQKTPAFIEAVLKSTLSELKSDATKQQPKERTPRGAFTDVGLHTGGKPRDICWSLILSTLQFMVSLKFTNVSADIIIQCLCCELELHWAKQHISRGGRHYSLSYANAAMQMLQSAVESGVQALHSFANLEKLTLTFSLEVFQIECRQARCALENRLAAQWQAVGEGYNLTTQPSRLQYKLKHVSFDMALKDPVLLTSGDLDVLLRRSRDNIGMFPLLSLDASLEDALVWIASIPQLKQDSVFRDYFVINSTEQYLFQKSMFLTDATQVNSFFLKSGNSIQLLESLVEKYRTVVEHVCKSQKNTPRMLTNLRSNEIVAVWASYCLIFIEVQCRVPLLAAYGVPLDATDFKHLVLSEVNALVSMTTVCVFIRESARKQLPIFSLALPSPTFNFAHSYCTQSDVMLQKWRSEEASANLKRDNHWAEVKRKQELVRLLEKERRVIECQLSSLESQKANINPKYVNYNGSRRAKTSAYAAKTQEISNETLKLENNWRKLSEARKAPPPVVQGLPSAQKLAFHWLFFLYLPPDLNSLCRMGVMAQQLFVPKQDSQILQFMTSPQPTTALTASHYQTYTSNTPSKNRIDVYSDGNVPQRNQIGPQLVMNCCVPSDGVWHPDAWNLRMMWKGGGFALDSICGGHYFDPFATHTNLHHARVEYFTELLPPTFNSLQWALPQFDQEVEAGRGNLPESTQDKKPNFFNKLQYLSFTALRAYPCLQYRKILVALRDGELPLTHPTVHVLLKQALYHVGPLSYSGAKDVKDNDGSPVPVWKSDFYVNDFTQLFFNQLTKVADELLNKPRERKAIMILAEIIGFLSTIDLSFRELSLKVALGMQEWSNDIDARIDAADVDESLISGLRGVQCMYYICGLVALGSGSEVQCPVAAVLMCKFMVQLQNRIIFEGSDGDAELRGSYALCTHLMSLQLKNICAVVSDKDLTGLVQLVFFSAPPILSWKQEDNSACFLAEANGHVYAINILTGLVLFDGNPSRKLPLDILNNDLYIRIFSDCNFEVFTSSSGWIETARPIKGHLYRFLLDANQNLFVEEVDVARGVTLRLLDISQISLVEKLPIQLRVMYSHWYFSNGDAIVFRNVGFKEKLGSFVATNVSSRRSRVYKLPDKHHAMSSIHWHSLFVKSVAGNLIPTRESNLAWLVLGAREWMQVMGKFESEAFMHLFLSADKKRLTLDLPRFGLSFVSSRFLSEDIFSLDFEGYKLARKQHLDDTLPGLTSYLLIEKDDKITRLLVPQGNIVIQSSAPLNNVATEDGYSDGDGYSDSDDGDGYSDGDGDDDGTINGTHYKSPIEIVVSEMCTAKLDYYFFDAHSRFHNFCSTCIDGRLELAALYAATSTHVPDSRCGMTGDEFAMQLVRECWTNRPLSELELFYLNSDQQFCFKTPALYLLCSDLIENTSRLYFLFPNMEGTGRSGRHEDDDLLSDMTTAYRNFRHTSTSFLPVHRKSLTVAEETSILGGCSAFGTLSPKLIYQKETVNIEGSPVCQNFVDYVSMKLVSEVTAVKAGPEMPVFPLSAQLLCSTTVGTEVYTELNESWTKHVTSDKNKVKEPRLIGERIKILAGKVVSKRKELELFLFESISMVPQKFSLESFDSKQNIASIAFNFLKIGTQVPMVAKRDLLVFSFDKETLLTFNPFLTKKTVCELHKSIIIWLQLCVLEDKLARLVDFEQNKQASKLLQELLVMREWDPVVNAKWLVFEVESQIQIRPVQYRVAKTLIDCPGAIAHLNMGEGKTRVILPMLILYFSTDRSSMLRLFFLSQLMKAMIFFIDI